MDTLDSSKKKSSHGGKRAGAGRQRGSQNKATLERLEVERKMKQRIMRNADRLLDQQFSLAQGCSYLFAKNKVGKAKPELIDDPLIIAAYLDGQLKSSTKKFFYIVTEKPDERALENLMDRTFGKPTQSLSVEGEINHDIPEETKISIDKLLERIL